MSTSEGRSIFQSIAIDGNRTIRQDAAQIVRRCSVVGGLPLSEDIVSGRMGLMGTQTESSPAVQWCAPVSAFLAGILRVVTLPAIA